MSVVPSSTANDLDASFVGVGGGNGNIHTKKCDDPLLMLLLLLLLLLVKAAASSVEENREFKWKRPKGISTRRTLRMLTFFTLPIPTKAKAETGPGTIVLFGVCDDDDEPEYEYVNPPMAAMINPMKPCTPICSWNTMAATRTLETRFPTFKSECDWAETRQRTDMDAML